MIKLTEKLEKEDIHLLVSALILVIVLVVLFYSNSIKKDTSSMANALSKINFAKVLG